MMSTNDIENPDNLNLNGIERLLSNGVNNLHVQEKYILPPSERPRLSDISFTASIPTVDLEDLDGPDRAQIVNHGMGEKVMKDMMDVGREFFEIPVQDRAHLYSEDPMQQVRVSPSINIRKEEVLNWRDYLRHPCHPLEHFIDSWPQKPSAYRDAAKYCTEVRALIERLLAAISQSLGLGPDYLKRILGEHNESMTINYYPPCPKPDLTMGTVAHSDASVITVLQQDHVSGLQVLKNGKWVAVEPIPNALVVNLGDQLQVVSNGRFRSVEHRAITNSITPRISIATFCIPSMDTWIAPAVSLVDDEQHPALYRGFMFQEFSKVFLSQALKGYDALQCTGCMFDRALDWMFSLCEAMWSKSPNDDCLNVLVANLAWTNSS
eukprot:Gb_32876 [translate_table: standard]